MRQVLSNLEAADTHLADFAYLRQNTRRKFDSGGRLKEEHTFLARHDFLDGHGFMRQVERDGEPVPEADLARETEVMRARIAEYEAMTEAQRQAVDAQRRKENEEARAWLREFPDALDYKKVGEEMVGGRMAIVLECTPHAGYKASNMRARVFEKVRGKVWIDKERTELVRVDAEVYETVNIGWGLLGKVYKGTRFHLERRKVDGPDNVEAWLPLSQTVRFTARVLLFKTLAQEESTRYSGFVHRNEPEAQFAE